MDEDDDNIGQRETAAKLGGTLEYNPRTIATLAKWMQNGEKKPRRKYAKKKVPTSKRLL